MQDAANFISQNELAYSSLITVVTVWTTVWKGFALWRSARSKQKYWFVAILVINTVGLLEIIYLTFSQKEKPFITKIKKKFSKISKKSK